MTAEQIEQSPNLRIVPRLRLVEPQSKPEIEFSQTQNGLFRKITKVPTYKVAEFLYKRGATADGLTVFGVGAVAVGTGIAELQNICGNKSRVIRLIAGGLVVVGLACDGLDGPVARVAEAETGKKSRFGPIKDTLADRLGEALQNALKGISASTQGHNWGREMAIANIALSAAPSAVRATDEALGYAVPENGDLLSFWGTRTGRAVLNTVATFFPKVRGIPTQPIIDTFGVATNALSTYQRLKVPFNGQTPCDLEPKQRMESLGKAVVLTGAFGLSLWAARRLNRMLP